MRTNILRGVAPCPLPNMFLNAKRKSLYMLLLFMLALTVIFFTVIDVSMPTTRHPRSCVLYAALGIARTPAHQILRIKHPLVCSVA